MPDVASLNRAPVLVGRTRAVRTARDPDAITGLKVWLPPDTSTKVVDGSNRVLSWTDVVTGGSYANAAADNTNPTLTAADANGLDVVDFDYALSQRLVMTDAAKIPFPGTPFTPFTIAAIVKPTSTFANFQTVWGVSQKGSGTQDWQAMLLGQNSNQRLYLSTAANAVVINLQHAGALYTTGAYQMFVIRILSPTVLASFRQNAASYEYAAGALGYATSIACNQAFLGYLDITTGSGTPLDAKIAEVCVWDRYISSGELAALVAYFEVRYGLTLS